MPAFEGFCEANESLYMKKPCNLQQALHMELRSSSGAWPCLPQAQGVVPQEGAGSGND